MAIERTDLVLVGVVLLGVVVVLAAPPEPIYSVSVSESATPDGVTATAFADLDEQAQAEFLDALDGSLGDVYEPPALENEYVRYEGAVYRVSVSVSEGSIFSSGMPILGGLLILIGCCGLLVRVLWRLGRRGLATVR